MFLKLTKNETIEQERELPEKEARKNDGRTQEIIYHNVLSFALIHISGIYGVYLCFTSAKWTTIMFNFIMYLAGILGITAGAHRLWSHKCFKAKMPLQIILIIFNSISFQNTAMDWARNHRMHHRYSDTDADPHNATRGFFYSHMGWLLVKKHPEMLKRVGNIDLSDIYNNPVLKFQKRYAIPVIGSICFILPTIIPMFLFEESFNNSWHLNMARYMINLNVIFLVNSAAHRYGYKPYDKNIMPSEWSFVNILTIGEGLHNYHHVFPWDYRCSELVSCINLTTKFIDFFARLGWAYDLKTVSADIISARAKRTGDISKRA